MMFLPNTSYFTPIFGVEKSDFCFFSPRASYRPLVLFPDWLSVGNSLIGGIFFKNSRLDLGKALEAGLSSLSTDSTESWETCF